MNEKQVEQLFDRADEMFRRADEMFKTAFSATRRDGTVAYGSPPVVRRPRFKWLRALPARIGHAFMVALPVWALLALIFANITGPRWARPMLEFGGWPCPPDERWPGLVFIFIMLYLVWSTLTPIHYLSPVHGGKYTGRWWWMKEPEKS